MKVRRTNLTPQTYGARLLQRGFHRIGGGSFAEVYGKEDWPYVIKVGHRADFAYNAFVRKVQRWGQKCPWLPRIVAAHRLLSAPMKRGSSRSEAEFVVVLMERLDDAQHEWLAIRRTIMDNGYGAGCKFLIPDLRLQRIMRMLRTAFDLDMHALNVCIRPGTDQVVLTDPIYTFRTAPKRIRL